MKSLQELAAIREQTKAKMALREKEGGCPRRSRNGHLRNCCRRPSRPQHLR